MEVNHISCRRLDDPIRGVTNEKIRALKAEELVGVAFAL